MADKEAAAAAKAKGNAALSAKNFEEAVAAYTEAIGHDGTDKVFYSNRSAAYASMGKWEEALADGQKCVELEPSFAKGYGRAGAALHGQGKYQEAVDIYSKGLEVDSGNAMLNQGLAAAQEKLNAASNPIANLFSDPTNLQKLMTNPQTSAFLSQPDFMQKIQQIAQNPSMMQMHMSDPRIQTALGVMLGMGDMSGAGAGGGPASGGSEPPPVRSEEAAEEVKSAAAERKMSAPAVELTEEEKEKLATQEKAEAVKAKGAACFKEAGKFKKVSTVKQPCRAKAQSMLGRGQLLGSHRVSMCRVQEPEKKAEKVTEAMGFFKEACEIDPTNMIYMNNVAACLYELKRYDECIENCNKAIELGRSNQADFAVVAKAYARIGNCQLAQDNLEAALESFAKSLMENHDDKVYAKQQATKKKKKKRDFAAFQDPAKAQECKEKGNASFKEGDYHAALKHYSEAIERDPKNHLLYSNRVAALTKIGQMPAALEDCDKCIELCPTFAKIYNRKGNIQFFLKEFHKCKDTFQKVIDLEPESRDATEAKEMMMKTDYAVRAAQSGPVDEQQQQRAMQDPEIQGILADPMIRSVLSNLGPGGDQKQAQAAMSDPGVAKKIEKLMAAGVLKSG
jgi:stress-induced-phosphoprotein 1